MQILCGCGFDPIRKFAQACPLGCWSELRGAALEVLNNGRHYGNSIPCMLTVLKSQATLQRPTVERFHCVIEITISDL